MKIVCAVLLVCVFLGTSLVAAPSKAFAGGCCYAGDNFPGYGCESQSPEGQMCVKVGGIGAFKPYCQTNKDGQVPVVPLNGCLTQDGKWITKPTTSFFDQIIYFFTTMWTRALEGAMR